MLGQQTLEDVRLSQTLSDSENLSCLSLQEKVRLVEIYNARLTDRERRRHFILDRGLLNVKRQQVTLPLCPALHRGPSYLCCSLAAPHRYLPQGCCPA